MADATNDTAQTGQTLYEQGVVQYQSRQYEAALQSFLAAQKYEPDALLPHWNEGLVRLILGDFKNGWPLHEARWQKNEGRWEADPAKRGMRRITQPLWVGDFDIAGKTVCLWHEQGFGDTLQFCRYALNVKAMGATPFLYVRDAMAELLRTSFAPHGITVVGDNEPLPAFDFHCPMMSLALACGTDSIEKIPTPIPYIFAKDEDIAIWESRLAAHIPYGLAGSVAAKKVGLVWSGLMRSPNPEAAKMDAERSVDFELLTPLLEMPNVQWVSLQKDGTNQHAKLLDLTDQLHSWQDTAALVTNLDLVISCDTAVAHLAAAMGKPTWILSRYNGCWRWLDHRDDRPRLTSPWYPTVRLFHQSAPGDWAGVVREVVTAILF